MTLRRIPKTLLLASLCFLSAPAFADQDDHQNNGSNSANAADRDNARETFLVGVGPEATGSQSLLVFTNTGQKAGTVTATLYAASTGTELATWTSASIPSFGSLQIDLSALVAAATPALTTAQAAAALDIGVLADFRGTVQTLVAGNAVVSDMSSCDKNGSPRIVGGVTGPASTTVAGAIRIGNAGDQADTLTLTLHSSTDGSTLGTWTSPSIPAHGSFTISGTALAAAAMPVVPTTTVSFTVEAGELKDHLKLAYLSQPVAGGLTTNLTHACRMAEIHPDVDADADDNGNNNGNRNGNGN